MCRAELDSGCKGTRTGNFSLLCSQDRFNSHFSLFLSSHLYHCLSLNYCLSLIFELTVTHLYDQMVNTCNRRDDPEPAVPNRNPPPPLTLAKTIASILESRDEQTELLWQLMANSTLVHGGNGARNNPVQAPTTYGDFTTTHLPLFTDAGEPLEADNWVRVMESKFRLLHCTKNQKTLFATQ
jgi:hypothetical protein